MLLGASSPSGSLLSPRMVPLTDNAAVKEPGDIGAAFHLRQSRKGPIRKARAHSTSPTWPSLHKPAPPGHSLASVATHKVHAVFSQPVKTLEEEKEREECDKAGAEVIPKDGEGQTSLSDSIPRTLQKVLEVGRGMMQT